MRTETINTTDEAVYKSEANELINNGFMQETVSGKCLAVSCRRQVVRRIL